MTIYKVEYQATIHVVLNVIAFGFDDDVIPLIQFEQFFIFFSCNQRLLDFLALLTPNGFLQQDMCVHDHLRDHLRHK